MDLVACPGQRTTGGEGGSLGPVSYENGGHGAPCASPQPFYLPTVQRRHRTVPAARIGPLFPRCCRCATLTAGASAPDLGAGLALARAAARDAAQVVHGPLLTSKGPCPPDHYASPLSAVEPWPGCTPTHCSVSPCLTRSSPPTTAMFPWRLSSPESSAASRLSRWRRCWPRRDRRWSTSAHRRAGLSSLPRQPSKPAPLYTSRRRFRKLAPKPRRCLSWAP